MTPTQISAGVIGVSLFLAGAWLGRSAVLADWTAEREQRQAEERWCCVRGLEPAPSGLQNRCSTI